MTEHDEYCEPANDRRRLLLLFPVLFLKALKLLEESRPVFEMATKMGSVALRDVSQLMAVKHKHITLLISLCRAWTQCISG